MMDLLKVENLSVTFSTYAGDVKAVRNVSFSVKEGETLAMVGESGCGKSVTAKAIMGLLTNSSGTISKNSVIEYNGVDLTKLRRKELNKVRGNEISMIFQDAMTSLNPTMTVGNQIVEAIRNHEKIGKAEALKRAEEMLKLVELPDAHAQLKRFSHELSGGMRQRVMIAMALSCNPKLLIADEPTTALDVTIQAQILELLKRLQQKLGMSVLLITHDLGVVAGIADRVQIMYGGSIVEEGTLTDIFKRPKHPYTAALLNAIPKNTMEHRGELFSLEGTPPDLRLDLNCCPFAPRCRYAMPVCKKQMPEYKNGVSCWLTHELAPKVELI